MFVIYILERVRQLSTSKESLMSPASPASNGGIYSVSVLLSFKPFYLFFDGLTAFLLPFHHLLKVKTLKPGGHVQVSAFHLSLTAFL